MARTQRPACTVQILPSGASWRPNSGKLQLDSFSVPYGRAQLELPIDATADLESIDPRANTRVQIIGSSDDGATQRPFNMGIQSREVDYRRRVVLVEAATDEALLQQYAALIADTGAREHEASLRDVVDYVLGKIGASLEPGGHDADVTAAWPVTNEFQRAADSAMDAQDEWATASIDTPMDTGTSTPLLPGTGYLVPRTTGTGIMRWLRFFSVTPGQLYTWSLHSRPAEDGWEVRAQILWYDRDENVISAMTGDYVVTGSAGYTRVHVTGTAPAGAETGTGRIWMVYPGSGNDAQRLAGVQWNEGPLQPFVYGGQSADALYSYSYVGDDNDSASTRTPFVERLPELFAWDPGEYAWDFLQPLLTAEGLRLFCDELQRWWLVDPAEYALPGLLRLTPNGNLTEGSDTITRSDPEVFATGVVVKYSWRDAQGNDRVEYDAAGDPQNVVTIPYARPYPGPGAAAAILARRNGSGRMQDVRALNDWTAQPSMSASIQMPDAPEQQGKISALDFDLGDAGTMAVQTRGLIDIPAGSWLAQDPALQWDDLGVTTPTWDTY